MSKNLTRLIILFFMSNILFAQDSIKSSEARAVTFFFEYGIKQGNFPVQGQIWFRGVTESISSSLTL